MLRLLLPLTNAAGLLTPLLVGQAARLSDTIRSNSARWEDYLRAAPEMIGARVFPALAGRGRSGQRLYPGTGLAVLALLGSAWLVRHRQYRLLISAWLLMAAGLVISVGLRLEFDKWQPYALLRQIHPGFSELRSPFRAAGFVQIALVGLAGWGAATLWRWRGRLGRVVAGSLVLVNLVEGWQLPARLYPYPEPQVKLSGWNGWPTSRPARLPCFPFPATRPQPIINQRWWRCCRRSSMASRWSTVIRARSRRRIGGCAGSAPVPERAQFERVVSEGRGLLGSSAGKPVGLGACHRGQMAGPVHSARRGHLRCGRAA
jgi:hypothetical protein